MSETDPWPVSVERLGSHLRSLHQALVSGEVGTERERALVIYDLGLEEAVTMLDLDVVTSRPMGAPMAAEQRRAVERALGHAGLDVEAEAGAAQQGGRAAMVAGRLRQWTALRHEPEACRYFGEVAAWVESLPEADWRLEALDYLRSIGQRSGTGAEGYAIFGGEGCRQALVNVGTAWAPASFDELLAALVVHEAQDLRWRDDL